MVTILQTTFSNAFCLKKNCVFWLQFHRSLFLWVQLTILQHWFRLMVNKRHLKYLPRCMKPYGVARAQWVNTLRPRQNGRRFADGTFKHIFLNENVRISIKISLKFVPEGTINNSPALVQIMAWRRSGDKPLSEPMMVDLLTHICVTRPQWVNFILSLGKCSYLPQVAFSFAFYSWWLHQMETSSALLALCAGNQPVTSEIPSQRPVTRSFGVLFDLRLNKRLLCKQSRRRWFETTSRSLWRHCNVAWTTFKLDCFLHVE